MYGIKSDKGILLTVRTLKVHEKDNMFRVFGQIIRFFIPVNAHENYCTIRRDDYHVTRRLKTGNNKEIGSTRDETGRSGQNMCIGT